MCLGDLNLYFGRVLGVVEAAVGFSTSFRRSSTAFESSLSFVKNVRWGTNDGKIQQIIMTSLKKCVR